MHALQIMFFWVVTSGLLAACGSEANSEISNTVWGLDSPYDLAEIPWGTPLEEVRSRIPRLVDHKPSETVGLRDDSVKWGDVELRSVLWFDKEGLKSINLLPRVENPKDAEIAANALKRKLEEVHGEPSEAESRISGYWRANWLTKETKISIAYIPAGGGMGEHAILVYARIQSGAEQDGGGQPATRSESK